MGSCWLCCPTGHNAARSVRRGRHSGGPSAFTLVARGAAALSARVGFPLPDDFGRLWGFCGCRRDWAEPIGAARRSRGDESQPEDALFVSSLLDMRTPGGRGKDKKDGANQTMGMYSKDSAFSRVLKLQEALYKVQGRIAKIADSLRALEESDRRMALEKQRLEILRMRATGAVDVPDPDGTAADDLDAPLEEDTEE